MFARTVFFLVFAMACSSRSLAPEKLEEGGNMYANWTNGPPKGADYFPIAVWLQSPKLASRYKEAGINLYVGLWKGPTEEQLGDLKAAGMPVICAQNEVGLHHPEDGIIVGWMHGDEPDNAQWQGEDQGYGPPIPPEQVVADYERIRSRDPSRPVLLNLGQGVAWDEYVGRGVRTNHPEDYLEYIKGADIVSFDIYPVASTRPEVSGKLWYVPRGVERLRQWAGDDQVVWNCIECTRIYSEDLKATPHQVKAEVWMSLIHGSMGLIYFVHEWKPKFNEHALLDDPEMLTAVTAINRQIHTLAPVLNSPTVQKGVEVVLSSPEAPVAAVVKQYGGAIYLFAVGMRDERTRASFSVPGLPAEATAEALGEGRTLDVRGGRFEDEFQAYEVHLYKVHLGPRIKYLSSAPPICGILL